MLEYKQLKELVKWKKNHQTCDENHKYAEIVSLWSWHLPQQWRHLIHSQLVSQLIHVLSMVPDSDYPLKCFMLDFSLLLLLAFQICLWQRIIKLQSFGSSCFWAFHCFAMDSKELSSISGCFGDQITNKNTKTYTIWLEMIAKVLNMWIGLKGNNYYSKVFKRVNYKLSNSTFWVVIIIHVIHNPKLFTTSRPLRSQAGVFHVNYSP